MAGLSPCPPLPDHQKTIEKIKQNLGGAPTVLTTTPTTPTSTAAVRSITLIATTPRQGARSDASQQPATVRKIDVDPVRRPKQTPQQTPFVGQAPKTTGKMTPKTTPNSPTRSRSIVINRRVQIRKNRHKDKNYPANGAGKVGTDRQE